MHCILALTRRNPKQDIKHPDDKVCLVGDLVPLISLISSLQTRKQVQHQQSVVQRPELCNHGAITSQCSDRPHWPDVRTVVIMIAVPGYHAALRFVCLSQQQYVRTYIFPLEPWSWHQYGREIIKTGKCFQVVRLQVRSLDIGNLA